jgi:hypothetical protein
MADNRDHESRKDLYKKARAAKLPKGMIDEREDGEGSRALKVPRAAKLPKGMEDKPEYEVSCPICNGYHH